MYDQMCKDFVEFLSKYQLGFLHNIQHCLLVMVEKWKAALYGRVLDLHSAVLTNLSKAFEYHKHDSLRVKLAVYGFGSDSLRFIYSYPNEREQRTMI